jgi:hypothetical protein
MTVSEEMTTENYHWGRTRIRCPVKGCTEVYEFVETSKTVDEHNKSPLALLVRREEYLKLAHKAGQHR